MSAIDRLPPLRTVIASHGLRAKKSLGQNFLLDLNLTGKIAASAGDLTELNVIEIGPGPGGLTRALLSAGARHVYAFEKDVHCIGALSSLIAASDGGLSVVEADALAINVALAVPAPRAIVANLPYNIATPLLLSWLRQVTAFRHMTLMFQKEVAERIVAVPNTKAYGRLSVMAQWLCQVKINFHLPPQAFTPPPKVQSSVVHFTPKGIEENAPSFDVMEQLVAAAFGQRRKMLRQSLKTALGGKTESLLETAGIKPTLRAEDLTVADYVRLAQMMSSEI
ncbi:MAG: 16S rRNA (adenine(1518)-N(6)/adenine(1519)-N(6))-dimethyltransferase RsmA [Pseudomonadota bacterium]|nr:16S rRNA (adenine(1518)-N(6)/adenine(1519)-N(6))-dimethyltransferase RsmA [Pseudomonadota bacterium]QKK04878.1 MAG: 16S rRNA (adenine(1518)-N(6)/adenine(1519)-N(6))-dimethyltransferase RsmA [Pseudomonadota bacterium]